MRSHLASILWLALVAQVSCSGGPTSASSDPSSQGSLQPELNRLWLEGQNALTELGGQWAEGGSDPIAGDVFLVEAFRFHWVSHSEPLELRGEPVGGYFDPNSGTIHYYERLMDGAVQHEAGHAILYVLGDRRWRCVFHGNCS